MQRRKAIATAGAITATAAAAVVAFGANFGIFGLAQQDSNVGKFPAVEATSTTPTTAAPSARDDQHGHERGDDKRHETDEDD